MNLHSVSAAAKYVPTADDVQLMKDIVQIATNGNFSVAVMQKIRIIIQSRKR